MRLAVIDNEGRVIVAWPVIADAHHDLADAAAEALHPGKRRARRRARTAATLRSLILALQRRV